MQISPTSARPEYNLAIENLLKNLQESIYGQDECVMEALVTLIAGGHLLMTGAPGLAKTTLVRVLARFLGLNFGRVQFTPDLLPSDITGSEILNIDGLSQKRTFDFSPGPIFTNLLLADEINRASPRTQSALLEAMQERNVTVGGKRHPLPRPFMVFGTQNPFESEGTFPLPEAQMDRFLIHSLIAYPDSQTEMKVLDAHRNQKLVGESNEVLASALEPRALSLDTLLKVMESAQQIKVSDQALESIHHLTKSTRPEDTLCPEDLKKYFVFGAGPRGGIALLSAARAFAWITGGDEVKWNHIERLAKPVLRHRIRLSLLANRDRLGVDDILAQLITRTREIYLSKARGLN